MVESHESDRCTLQRAWVRSEISTHHRLSGGYLPDQGFSASVLPSFEVSYIFVMENYPVPYRMFSSILGLYSQ